MSGDYEGQAMGDPSRLALRVHPGLSCICRLAPGEPLPAWAAPAEFCSVTRTPEQLSVVCDQDVVPQQIEALDRAIMAFREAGYAVG